MYNLPHMKLKNDGFWSTACLVALTAGLSAQTPAPAQPAQPPAQAQPAAPPQQEKPTFRVQVDLVTNDVIVRDDKGNFIPDSDGKVIDFKGYRPGKGTPLIYNLPGRFVKKAGSPP